MLKINNIHKKNLLYYKSKTIENQGKIVHMNDIHCF